jgi:hypothetical protein
MILNILFWKTLNLLSLPKTRKLSKIFRITGNGTNKRMKTGALIIECLHNACASPNVISLVTSRGMRSGGGM